MKCFLSNRISLHPPSNFFIFRLLWVALGLRKDLVSRAEGASSHDEVGAAEVEPCSLQTVHTHTHSLSPLPESQNSPNPGSNPSWELEG